MDSFKYTKSTQIIVPPSSSTSLKVTCFGPSGPASELQNKLSNISMVTDQQPDLNQTMPVLDKVKTNFSVSDDSNAGRIQKLVKTLKSLNDPRFMSDITKLIKEIKTKKQSNMATIDPELNDLVKLC